MEEDYISDALLHKKNQREQDLISFQKNADQAEEEVRRWNKQRTSSHDEARMNQDNFQFKENVESYSNQGLKFQDLQNKSNILQGKGEVEFPEEQIHQKLNKIRDLLGLKGKSEQVLNESSPIHTKQKKQLQQIQQYEQGRVSSEDNYLEFANTFGKNDRIHSDLNLLGGESQSEQMDFLKSNLATDEPVNYATSTFNRNFKLKGLTDAPSHNMNSEFKDSQKNYNQQIIEENPSEQKIDTRRFLNEYINNFDNNFEVEQKKQLDDENPIQANFIKPSYYTSNQPGNRQNHEQEQMVDVQQYLANQKSNLRENSFHNNTREYIQNQQRDTPLNNINNRDAYQKDRSNSFNKSNNQSHNASYNQGSFIDSGKKDAKNNNYMEDYDAKIPTTSATQATTSKQNNTMRSLNQNMPTKFEISNASYMKTEPSNRLNEFCNNNPFYYKKSQVQSVTPSSRLQNQNDERQNQSLQQIRSSSPFRATFQDKSSISHIGIGDKQNTSLLNQSQIQMLDNSNLNIPSATIINNPSNAGTNQRTKSSFIQQYSPPQKLMSEEIYYLDSNEKEMQLMKDVDEVREDNNTQRLNNLFQQQVGVKIDQDGEINVQYLEQQLQELTNKNKSLMNDNIRILQQKEQLHKALMKKESENTQLSIRITDLERKLEEKSDESKLKRKLELAIQDNTKGLQEQIEELQKTINEQTFEMQSRANQERFQRHKINQQQNQYYLREEELKNEVQFLKKEIENMKYNRDIIKNRGESEIKSRVLELETDLHITRSQYHTLIQEKTMIEQQLEENQQANQQSLSKLQQELQSAHQEEIQELQYYVISIKQEYEKIMQQLKNVKASTKKKDLQQVQQANTKKFHNTLLIQDKQEKEMEDEEVEDQNDLQKKVKTLIEEKNILHDEKFKLTQQISWLQLKQKSQSYMEQKVEALMHERRFNQLTDMMIYWKKNCSQICKDYLLQLSKLKKENEKLKSTVQTTQKRFLSEYESIVKEIAKKYQIESEQLHMNLKEMQQKYVQSQSKLAEVRSKLNSSLVSQNNNTQINSSMANQIFAPMDFSKATTEKKPPVHNRSKQNNSHDYSINFKQINQKILASTSANQEQEKTKKKKKVVY